MRTPEDEAEIVARIRRNSGDELADLYELSGDYLAKGPRFQAAVQAEVARGLAEVFGRIGLDPSRLDPSALTTEQET